MPAMPNARDDLLGLFDFAWGRFRDRMAGLDDQEWAWTPVAGDDRVSIRWRLDHLADLLTEDRNASWLGLPRGPQRGAPVAAPDGATAVDAVRAGFAHWRGLLRQADDEALGRPIGFGPYAASSRYSFALHLADEMIHHTAEAALLRDLYPGTTVGERERG